MKVTLAPRLAGDNLLGTGLGKYQKVGSPMRGVALGEGNDTLPAVVATCNMDKEVVNVEDGLDDLVEEVDMDLIAPPPRNKDKVTTINKDDNVSDSVAAAGMSHERTIYPTHNNKKGNTSTGSTESD